MGWTNYTYRAILVLGLFSAGANCYGQSPSFICANAREPDELAICSNPKLAELDKLVAAGYKYARAKLGESQAKRIGVLLLRSRQSCGSNEKCIEESQLNAISEYQALGAAIGTISSSHEAGHSLPKKIVTSAHSGYGTILSLNGLNTEHSTMSYTRVIEDSEETCSREMNLIDENHKIRRTPKFNQCVHEDPSIGVAFVRRANCIANIVILENRPPNQLVKFDVKAGYIETDWLDLKTNELTGDCSACGGPEKLDTFKNLCPAKYREFGGTEDGQK
jgi:hypothetical protein